MVNFAELKEKAGKAKDVGLTKMTNTKDKFISAPSSKMNWDPNWKRPPPASAPRGATSSASSPPPPPVSRSRPPPVLRNARPTDDLPPPPPYMPPPPPPTRVVSGYPPAHGGTSQDSVERIDWANLSPEDKEEFFSWLDEYFSRYLRIELGPRQPRQALPPAVKYQRTENARPPPMVNVATRPQV